MSNKMSSRQEMDVESRCIYCSVNALTHQLQCRLLPKPLPNTVKSESSRQPPCHRSCDEAVPKFRHSGFGSSFGSMGKSRGILKW